MRAFIIQSFGGSLAKNEEELFYFVDLTDELAIRTCVTALLTFINWGSPSDLFKSEVGYAKIHSFLTESIFVFGSWELSRDNTRGIIMYRNITDGKPAAAICSKKC